jgi:hypothetical protein
LQTRIWHLSAALVWVVHLIPIVFWQIEIAVSLSWSYCYIAACHGLVVTCQFDVRVRMAILQSSRFPSLTEAVSSQASLRILHCRLQQ